MTKGLWVWPEDAGSQRVVLKKISASPHLVAALKAVAKSKEGMSNAEVDDALDDHSNWMTLWVVRQLTALGFVEYKVDFFGGPARYTITDAGRSVLQAMTGQPAPKPAQSPAPPPKPVPQPAVAPQKPAAPPAPK
jgi:hypothetical protein